MYINVSRLIRELSGSTRAYEIDEDCALLDGSRPRRISGSVTMLRTDQGIWVSAGLDTGVQSNCARCLEEYVQPVHMAIEEEFLLELDEDAGTRISRSEDGDQYCYISPDHILNLTEAATQYAILSMPMKPVCREDCAGMCLECGTNLNESPCRCDKEPVDARWAVLSTLVSGADHDR